MIKHFDINAIDKAEPIKLDGRFVYFLMRDDIPVYIGKTTNILSRITGHN
tara:strand:- start:43 stop:192 length:150 start_codon:yes stop_codon:yes gene_type:complete